MQVAHSQASGSMPPRQLFPEGLACRFTPEQTDEFHHMIHFFLLPALCQALLRAELPRVFLASPKATISASKAANAANASGRKAKPCTAPSTRVARYRARSARKMAGLSANRGRNTVASLG